MAVPAKRVSYLTSVVVYCGIVIILVDDFDFLCVEIVLQVLLNHADGVTNPSAAMADRSADMAVEETSSDVISDDRSSIENRCLIIVVVLCGGDHDDTVVVRTDRIAPFTILIVVQALEE